MAQVATFGSLRDGDYEGKFPIGKLRSYGDFGLGTFDRLDGEMIVLDGKIYHAGADGRTDLPGPDVKTPFACVVPFHTETTFDVGSPITSDGLKRLVDAKYDGPQMLAIRIDGVFRELTSRAFPPQSKPYKPLAKLAAEERRKTYSRVSGTLVGFRMPATIGNLNVPGYHFHFLTKDRKAGGHVLKYEIESATVKVMALKRIVAIGR